MTLNLSYSKMPTLYKTNSSFNTKNKKTKKILTHEKFKEAVWAIIHLELELL